MKRHSLRTQLVWGNVLTLAVLLGVLGIVVHYAAAAAIYSSVDRELDARTRPPPGDRRGPPPGDRRGPPPGDGGRRDGPPPDGTGEAQHTRENFQPPNFGGRGGRSPRHNEPFGPRILDAAGPNTPAPYDPSTLSQAAGGTTVFSTVTVNGERLRVASRPFPGGRVLQAAYPLADADRALAGLNGVLLTLIPFALLCAAALGIWLTGRVLRRVDNLTRQVADMGAGDLSARLRAVGNDEFAALAGTFNGLLARLQAAFARQQQMTEQQRRFTADASHELKTPLTVIRGNASLALSSTPSPESSRELMTEIDDAAQRMARLVSDLLLLARADAGQIVPSRERVHMTAVLAEAVSRTRRPDAAPITVNAAPDLSVMGNADELVRVFANLLDNALRFTPPTGKVTVTAACDSVTATVTVADTGTGIAREHLPHLGERFYRADAARTRHEGGTGLGLSICRAIAEAHGGSLEIDSAPGAGTTATVTLPAPPRYGETGSA